MKTLRVWLIGVAVVLLALAATVWFLPARWTLTMLGPRLHGLRLAQVGGLLWDGHAGRVSTAAGEDLGRVQWTLSRRALLGELRAHLALQRPGLSFAGDVRRVAPGEVVWRHVELRADAALLDGSSWLAGERLRGRLDVHIVQAEVQGLWPMQLDATAHWHDAAVATLDGPLPLGDFHLQAHGADGVIRLAGGDDGRGPLQASGQASLSPLGWNYAVTLRPRAADPALHRWLARFGALSNDGTLRLAGSGGLMQILSRMERR